MDEDGLYNYPDDRSFFFPFFQVIILQALVLTPENLPSLDVHCLVREVALSENKIYEM